MIEHQTENAAVAVAVLDPRAPLKHWAGAGMLWRRYGLTKGMLYSLKNERANAYCHQTEHERSSRGSRLHNDLVGKRKMDRVQ